MSLGVSMRAETVLKRFQHGYGCRMFENVIFEDVPSEITISGGALQYKYLLGTSQIMDFDT